MNATCFTCLSTEYPLTPMKDVYWEILKALLSQQIDVDYICSAVTELCLCGKCGLLLHDVSVFRDKAVNSVHQHIELWNQNVDTVSCNNGTDMDQVELKTEIVDEESEGVMDSVVDTYKPEDDVTSNIKLEIKEESDWAHVEQLCESMENHDDLESLADQADNSELSDTSNVNQYCSKTKKNDDNTTQSKRKRKAMETTKKQYKTREDILEAKRRASRIRYEKIKKDSKLYELRKEQQKENYAKRKKEKRLMSIKEKSAGEQQKQRQKWRKHSRAYYCKKKQSNEVLQVNIEEEEKSELIEFSGRSGRDPLLVELPYSVMPLTQRK